MNSAKYLKRAAGAVAFAVALATSSQPAPAFIGTAMAVASFAQMAIGASNRTPNMQLEYNIAILDTLQSIRGNLKAIEQGEITLLKEVHQFPKVVQESLERNNMEVFATHGLTLAKNLRQDLVDIKRSRGRERQGKIWQTWLQIRDLRNYRGDLQTGSDLSLPAMVVEFLEEMSALRVVPGVAGYTPHELAIDFDVRLAQAQDPTRLTSLVSIRKQLEADQANNATILARDLNIPRRAAKIWNILLVLAC